MKHIIKKPTKEALKVLNDYWRDKKEKADWVNEFQDKNVVRLSLLIEQGYICAYCMQRVEDNPLRTTIEHWEARELLKKMAEQESDIKRKREILQKAFDYNNLFLVCQGHYYNKTGKLEGKHCDASRANGNRELLVKPNDPTTLQNIKYIKGTGRIYAVCGLNNETMEQDDKCAQFNNNTKKPQKPHCDLKTKCTHCDLACDKGLNLNLLPLMDNRRKALTTVQKEFEQFCKNKNFEQAETIKKRIIAKYVHLQNDRYMPYSGIIAFFYKRYL